MAKCRAAVVGCGEISGIYLKNLTGMFAHMFDVAVCADLVLEKAERRAREFSVPRACRTVEEALEDPTIETVVNLTNPQSHAAVNLAAVKRGRHVYCEKPFAVTREEALEILTVAKEKGALTSGAPDTILGASVQTARKALDGGWIGKPVAASASIPMCSYVEEGLHPNTEAFVRRGGETLPDMGPYFIAALAMLLGPVKRVTGMTRGVPSGLFVNPASPRYMAAVPFEMPMTAAVVMEHEGGALSTLILSKEAFGYFPVMDIFGSEGVLHCGDPNKFGEPVAITGRDWKRTELTLPFDHAENSRGIGAAEMMAAARAGRQPRVSGEFCAHVLDVMLGLYDAAATGRTYEIACGAARPEAMPGGRLGSLELFSWK